MVFACLLWGTQKNHACVCVRGMIWPLELSREAQLNLVSTSRTGCDVETGKAPEDMFIHVTLNSWIYLGSYCGRVTVISMYCPRTRAIAAHSLQARMARHEIRQSTCLVCLCKMLARSHSRRKKRFNLACGLPVFNGPPRVVKIPKGCYTICPFVICDVGLPPSSPRPPPQRQDLFAKRP